MDYNEYYEYSEWPNYFKGHKYSLGKDDPHIPNKNEGKMLRKLMSENGMTEEEVRGIKKYRILLANASKKGEKLKGDVWYNNNKKKFWKVVTKKTGLPKEHPLSKYVYNKELLNYGNRWLVSYFKVHPLNLSKSDLEILKNYDLTTYKKIKK